MMKLVISLDELEDFEDDTDNTNVLSRFLENQFPEWDIAYAMSLNKAEYDFDNGEVSIPLHPL